ncbi:queuosine precursor transporter [Sphingomonas sp. C3-2]|uniref:queuosine precursor transporter n=1 Tax=Sphingomonas sp. C3-2 TaxID=3062169 RepID=UPI00294AF4AA|nr:queuosine precursor transporter [Sphingomonas sp. C3-2]WOK35148.1 queuosine precursor transporter [Sphingomonas sp. C3-2]
MTVTIPRSLFVFSVLYGGMTCVAGVLGNKQVSLGPLAVEAGIFAFLLLVVMSSAVAELHGRDNAGKLVRFGFIPLIFAILLFELVLALPASPSMEPARLEGFQLVLSQSPRLMFAGIIAYGVSQMLNITIFSALRSDSGRAIWVRGAIAGVLSQVVDSLIFITLAFYGVFPIGELLLGQMLAKAVLSAVIVPPLIHVFVALGRKLDANPAKVMP